jgi:hypothetical protein
VLHLEESSNLPSTPLLLTEERVGRLEFELRPIQKAINEYRKNLESQRDQYVSDFQAAVNDEEREGLITRIAGHLEETNQAIFEIKQAEKLFQQIQAYPEKLLCCVCTTPTQKVRHCPNGHIVCNDCLSQIMFPMDPSLRPRCPMCCTRFDPFNPPRPCDAVVSLLISSVFDIPPTRNEEEQMEEANFHQAEELDEWI